MKIREYHEFFKLIRAKIFKKIIKKHNSKYVSF